MIVGLLHPGEMGSAVGARVDADVIWASEGRSDATRTRGARFRDVTALDALVVEANVILSICPPHAALDVARACFGVEDDWRALTPELTDRLARAERSAAAKGWRWIGEMEEIADTFAAAGQPDGFQRAAAEVYRS